VSIRLRLTLWYGLLFAFLVAIAGLGVWWQFDDGLRRSLEDALRIHAEDVEAGLEQGGNPVHTLEPPRPGVFAAVQGPGGVTIDAGPGMPSGLPLVPAGASVAQLGVGGPTYALYAVRLSGDRMLVTGSSLAEVDRSAGRLAETLIMIGAACAVASLVGGWWLAGRALAPMRDLTREADSIEAGELDRRLPVAHPHDEVGNLARTLNRLLTRIEDAVTRERAFINGAAHDLRTPIAALRMQLDLLLRGGSVASSVEGEVRSSLEDARNDTVALGELADALLGLAEAQAAGPNDAVDVNVLPMLVSRAEQEVERLAAGRTVRIEQHVDEATVRVSAVRFHQALTNLLTNAVRHGPAGGTVDLEARIDSSVSGRGPVVLVEVGDRGPGIDAQLQEELFVPFAMPRKASTAHGLGLATAAVAVRSQGGEIGYRDRPGGGSVFWFWLPIAGGH